MSDRRSMRRLDRHPVRTGDGDVRARADHAFAGLHWIQPEGRRALRPVSRLARVGEPAGVTQRREGGVVEAYRAAEVRHAERKMVEQRAHLVLMRLF